MNRRQICRKHSIFYLLYRVYLNVQLSCHNGQLIYCPPKKHNPQFMIIYSSFAAAKLKALNLWRDWRDFEQNKWCLWPKNRSFWIALMELTTWKLKKIENSILTLIQSSPLTVRTHSHAVGIRQNWLEAINGHRSIEIEHNNPVNDFHSMNKQPNESTATEINCISL